MTKAGGLRTGSLGRGLGLADIRDAGRQFVSTDQAAIGKLNPLSETGRTLKMGKRDQLFVQSLIPPLSIPKYNILRCRLGSV